MSFRFAPAERPDIGVVTKEEKDAILRRLHDDDGMSCCKTLHIGIFFDGTRNNAERDKSGHKHSNVARLRDAFLQDRYHKSIYVAGVGTPFSSEIGDYGIGLQAVAGASAGWAGEGRINWALLQIHNAVHECAFRVGLSTALGVDDKNLVRLMSLDMNFKGIDLGGNAPQPGSTGDIKSRSSPGIGALKLIAAEQYGAELTWDKDTNWSQLKDDLDSSKWAAAVRAWDGRRRKILGDRRAQLKARVGDMLVKGKPRIQRIRLYVFGFSRGAAEARTFSNWLVDALESDFSLCGVPVSYDFLGIFDTVASVGIAQSAAATLFDGHGGWARKELMAVPHYVRRCVHMVAAHEPRGSFPLDLIDCSLEGREEIVYPGVHSDVGGGYGPAEQGRGRGDADKLSQVPLVDMYRAARIAGVPLDIQGPGITSEAADAFKISAGLKQAFAAYVKASEGYYYAKEHGTAGLMRAHYGLYLRWRRMRLKDMSLQPSFKAAQANCPQDAMDIDSANNELKAEWEDLLEIEKGGGPSVAHYAKKFGAKVARDNPKIVASVSAVLLPGVIVFSTHPEVIYGVRKAGDRVTELVRAQLQEKWEQWQQVRSDWNMGPPEAPISALYDNYMHDSRAWFKPLGDDDDVWNYKQIQELKSKQASFEREHAAWKKRAETGAPGPWQIAQAMSAGASGLGPIAMQPEPEPRSPLTAQQADLLKRYDAAMQSAKQARAAKDPNAPTDSAVLTDPKVTGGLALQTSGREFYFLWGFLRWRTVFVNGVRWDQPRVPTVQEEMEGMRMQMQRQVDMKGIGVLFQ
ncbi:secreted protein hcp [Burkholderia pseudomallei]|uniref:T6SS Phospholipase effector Tle1-like catalytic domain-containing protein n=1 Tax=Burkholderia pseudomallei TaxID=28450 RepID=A0A2K9CTP4_BURPE|nr:DUF2235 domain-containing protein [Burkholderia pseudomallei]AIP03841.1 hypothetical protein DP51_571 [Burkholderia pseudomallei]AUG21451.1 DUF2235 domain-containing protein [Burkholderia pseudomallei]KGC82516.1 hypothetical protein DO71_3698 [Burkholderia pseudomallei]KGS62664.1 hypothetical protein X979_189 [Burkholderia pseudomallei MSHR7527]KGW30630.1 hypothetical protein Y045_1056 [Burkholderia pseudomallei MSHR2451]